MPAPIPSASHPIDLNFEPCPKCGLVMTLTLVAPERPGHDRRLFQCADCGYAESRVVPVDGEPRDGVDQ